MLTLLKRRLWQAILVAWSVGTLTFILMRLLPGDFAYRIAAGRYGYDQVNRLAAEAVQAELGLDQPAWLQYLYWLWDLVRFDLGNSLVSGAPVIQEIQHQLGHSLQLALFACLFSLLLALPIGLYCGKRPGGRADRIALFFSALLRAQPVFVIGLLLVLLFALQLGWFPVAGFGGSQYLVLPALSLALAMAALSNRIIRNNTATVMASPYLQFARLKGLSRSQAFARHAQPNIALPVLAFVGVQAIALIEGIVMIESLFSWPGIGHALAHAIFGRDVPMIQGTALLMGLLFVAINTAVDLAGYWLDPRQREAAYD
ncbi:ABC transporter permease [Ferrimonas marina]|uniref:Peptide/nickel transport system permease protein n=1 Tax=Ferrimonas marina TaxID=299255 RepID=A0A1M5ZAF0_9GAMM|nr:ABC transporter permease [Ferrimonas marina]SHI20873.1 peptide/nickel transport system permease protein [Ferrimonas marina]